MKDGKTEHISLCKVSHVEHGQTSLIRLADIEDGVIKVLDHQTYLQWNNEPDRVGTFGVWKWYSASDDKEPDFTSSYMSDVRVIEIIEVPGASDAKGVVDRLLKKEITSQPASSKVLFCAKTWKFYDGIMCTSEDISVKDGHITVNDDVIVMPQYSLDSRNTITLQEKIFYRFVNCGRPIGGTFMKNPLGIIHDIVAEHLSRPTAESLGLTENVQRNMRELITSRSASTIIQEVAAKIQSTQSTAKKYVDEFIEKVDHYIKVEDGDNKVFAAILDKLIARHHALQKKCEEIISAKFFVVHQEEINTLHAEIEQAKELLRNADETLKAKNCEISSAQDELSDLEQSIHEHEKLARAKPVLSGENLPAENLASLTDWKDAAENLRYELVEAGVSEDYSLPFAALMCAACLNSIPLLLAGPNAQDIADAFAATLSGRTAGVIDCSGGFYPEIAREIDEASDEVFAVKNALRSEWVAHIPDLQRHGKYFFIVHPFAEDLLIEPKSLFTYTLPVFTELICDSVPSRNFAGARKAPNFEPFTHGTAAHIPDTPLQKLGMTTFTRSRLRAVLADFHVLHDQDEKFDTLFVLFPYAYIAGHVSSVLEKVSDARLRNELAAFAGEEDA